MLVGYTPGSGPLHRAHPFTALSVGLTFGALSFLVEGIPALLALTALAIGLALMERMPGVIVKALPVLLPFWGFLLLIHGLIGNDLGRAVSLGLRITVIVLAFLTVLAAVNPARLVEAAVEKGLPFGPAYLVATTLKVVPDLRERGRVILEGQRCRGMAVTGSLGSRIRALVALVHPLILSSLSETDERTVALEIRGVSARSRKTALDPPADSRAEQLLRWSLLLIVGVALWFRVYPG